MTRTRNYILKNDKAPEEDLWLEADGSASAVPLFKIYCEGENGKQCIVTLTSAMAERLLITLSKMVEYSKKPFEDYVTEKDPND